MFTWRPHSLRRERLGLIAICLTLTRSLTHSIPAEQFEYILITSFHLRHHRHHQHTHAHSFALPLRTMYAAESTGALLHWRRVSREPARYVTSYAPFQHRRDMHHHMHMINIHPHMYMCPGDFSTHCRESQKPRGKWQAR